LKWPSGFGQSVKRFVIRNNHLERQGWLELLDSIGCSSPIREESSVMAAEELVPVAPNETKVTT
jgi:hypothetical protein